MSEQVIRILSFDCANKTIGVAMIEIPTFERIKTMVNSLFDVKEVTTIDQALTCLKKLDDLKL